MNGANLLRAGSGFLRKLGVFFDCPSPIRAALERTGAFVNENVGWPYFSASSRCYDENNQPDPSHATTVSSHKVSWIFSRVHVGVAVHDPAPREVDVVVREFP